MKRVLIPGVILCGADVAQAVDDKNMYMHFFEEMTVYAPVPVPVNGNTHYTSESIERLPTGNGNISDLLRTNPAVRIDPPRDKKAAIREINDTVRLFRYCKGITDYQS